MQNLHKALRILYRRSTLIDSDTAKLGPKKDRSMQLFVVVEAEDGPEITNVYAFWSREAAYRYYRDGGGKSIPRRHLDETLETRLPGKLVQLSVIQIPDRQRYDERIIHRIVDEIKTGKITQAEATRKYGVSQASISIWMRRYT